MPKTQCGKLCFAPGAIATELTRIIVPTKKFPLYGSGTNSRCCNNVTCPVLRGNPPAEKTNRMLLIPGQLGGDDIFGNHNRSELQAQARRAVLVENGQLVTKGKNLRLQGGTGPKTGGDQSETSKTELIVEATMIPRMIITSAFSDRTEFSVSTGGLQTGHSGNSRHSAVRSVH